MVRGCERVGTRRPPRRVNTQAVPEPRGDPGLVVRDPARDAVAEPAGDASANSPNASTVARSGQPPASSSATREIPVVERDERLDLVREQLVDEPVVEVEPGVVHASRALPAAPAARRPRSGTRSARARASAPRPRGSGGRSRRPLRRSSPFRTLPLAAQKRSQMLSPRPSSADRALDLVGSRRHAPAEAARETAVARCALSSVN